MMKQMGYQKGQATAQLVTGGLTRAFIFLLFKLLPLVQVAWICFKTFSVSSYKGFGHQYSACQTQPKVQTHKITKKYGRNEKAANLFLFLCVMKYYNTFIFDWNDLNMSVLSQWEFEHFNISTFLCINCVFKGEGHDVSFFLL